jgi:hypothetical protein
MGSSSFAGVFEKFAQFVGIDMAEIEVGRVSPVGFPLAAHGQGRQLAGSADLTVSSHCSAFVAKADGNAFGVQDKLWCVEISIEQAYLLRLDFAEQRVTRQFLGRLGAELQL